MTTKRYHKIDGWRGYPVPALAIVGASDTGTWDDSPCPSNEVKAELNRFRREVLKPAGIASRTRIGHSSNVFCAKRWLLVSKEDFDKSARLAVQWLKENRYDTDFIHSADLEQLGYTTED
jgi:hypothetical protein